MKKLPLTIQTFSKLRDNDCVYIDKTELIHQLLMGSRNYFFARPRRFGKSMTLSTLKSIYKGEKHYFEGLWIENNWDWTKIHPIVHLKFASMSYRHSDVPTALCSVLQKSHWSIIFRLYLTLIRICLPNCLRNYVPCEVKS